MGEDVVVHDRPQLLERMATMASALGSWTVPVGIRPMQLPSSSQRSVQRSATPPGAADEVQVEPPLVVVMKKSVPVEAAEESAPWSARKATQSDAVGHESCSTVELVAPADTGSGSRRQLRPPSDVHANPGTWAGAIPPVRVGASLPMQVVAVGHETGSVKCRPSGSGARACQETPPSVVASQPEPLSPDSDA
jgi:hypothetical protein